MSRLIDRLRGRSYKDRLLHPYDEFWDRRLGVRTFGYYPAEGRQGDLDWRVHYNPTPYTDLFRLLRLVGLSREDVFVDLGAGMGRAVFTASWLGASKAIGVEVAPRLCDIASQNYLHSRLVNRDIEFVPIGAQDYRNPDITVCFMFHPFGEATLIKVLQNMEVTRPRKQSPKLRIIYVNPVFDFVLKRTPWLQCVGHVPAMRRWLSTGADYETSLWECRDS